MVVLLAGGTGGAKLAARDARRVGDELTVIANTGDDIEIYGSYVSPDPDLVTFWLADRIDERGWGIKDDTFAVMDGLSELGEDIWFNLGDRDLAICLRRARRLGEGARLTEAIDEHATRAGRQGASAADVRRTGPHVRTARGRLARLPGVHDPRTADGPVTGVEFRGAENASRTPQVREASQTADMIVIGPSNPVISIGPILAVGEMRAELRHARRRSRCRRSCAARSLKGPTDAFMAWAGHPLSSDGIAAHYDRPDRRPRRRRAGRPRCPTLTPTSRWATRRRAGAWRRELARASLRTRHVRTTAVLPVKSLRERQATARRRGRRRGSRGARRGDGRRRADRADLASRTIDDVVVVTAEPLAARAAENGRRRGRERPGRGRPVGGRQPWDRRGAGARRRARAARARRLPGGSIPKRSPSCSPARPATRRS